MSEKVTVCFEWTHSATKTIKKEDVPKFTEAACKMGFRPVSVDDLPVYAVCDACWKPMTEDDEDCGHDCNLCKTCYNELKQEE